MITLYDARTDTALGTVSEEQLQGLIDNLEEEWLDDQDYYVNEPTIDVLQAAGVSAPMLDLLRKAIGSTGEADIRWSRS